MTLTQADVIAFSLKQQDVEVVFGLPGGENVPLVAALDRVGIRFILMRHESRAVWAADAYGRIGRRVGVCLSTLGPGAANLAAGLAHAYLDRSAVLAITAQLPADLMNKHSHQRLDLAEIFSPVVKRTFVVKEDSDAGEIIAKAMQTAKQGRHGPVYVQMSSPVSTSSAPVTPQTNVQSPIIHKVTEDVINLAVTLLRSAKRPAIVTGTAAEPAAPYALLQQMAELLQAPVIVTPKAKGALAESHQLYSGVLGLERKEYAAGILQEADLIMGVGFDPVELMVPWSFTAPFIYAGPAPNEDPEIPAAVELVGDLRHILGSVVSQLQDVDTAQRKSWTVPFSHPGKGDWPDSPAGSGFLPSKLIKAAREILPDEGIVTIDVGAHKLLIGKLWPARSPNRFLLSNGLSTMGYALPAAIGAKLARPDLPVVCFAGDGGLGMVDSALETAVRLKLAIVVVVLADEAMSLIRLKQIASGNKPIGTLMGPTDWVSVSQGFGANGVAAADVAVFRKAFASALQSDQPTLIEARIDPAEYQTF